MLVPPAKRRLSGLGSVLSRALSTNLSRRSEYWYKILFHIRSLAIAPSSPYLSQPASLHLAVVQHSHALLFRLVLHQLDHALAPVFGGLLRRDQTLSPAA